MPSPIGAVRHRTQQLHKPDLEVLIPTPERFVQKRQPSRSPRASPNHNPYSEPAKKSISFALGMALSASMVISLLLLQSSISFPWIPLQENHSPMLRRIESNVYRDHAHPPRVLFLEGECNARSNRTVEALSDHITQNEWTSPEHHDRCLPKASWQTSSFPNCNSIHEIDVALSSAEHVVAEDSLTVLGEGWFRTTWRMDKHHESVVLKTLRIEREFLSEYYELHRRDAVAMERLTSSPFVVDVYGYCGQSAINELANFPFPGIQNLEVFNRRMRGKDSAKSNAIKLRMAASIALGLADIHAAGSNNPDDENVYMAHYDLNPRNIALFAGGRPKINDFNIAEFLRYDPATNKTCKFPSRLHEPWWRAPEEMNTTHTVPVDEKVDVYALGNILFHTLTSHSARGKQIRERMPLVRPIVAAGIRPIIPEMYRKSTDPNVVAIVKAIDLCWTKGPEERATAEEVAAVLYEALLSMTDTAEVEEKELEKQEGVEKGAGVDDDAPEQVIEDKDAMGHDATT